MELEVVVQEERQEEGSWVTASLIVTRACACDCACACATAISEEVVGEGAGATTSAAIAELMITIRIERRWRVRRRFSIAPRE